MNLKKGFTLLELLVVVAIIGVLSAVVLASLNNARSKGSDAAVKSNLDGVRNQAAIYYDNNGSYGTLVVANACTGANAAGSVFVLDQVIANQIKSANAAGAGLQSCSNSASAYAISVQLKSSSTAAWCVDGNGKSKQETMATADQAGLNGVMTASTCN